MYISKVVELTTLSPLYIRGKEIDYGEGLLKGKDGHVYLIDNDKLCDYIDQKGKVDEYVKYFVRDENRGYNDIEGFADFMNIRIRLDDFIADGYVRGSVAYVKKEGQKYRINVRDFKNYMKKQDPSLEFSSRRDDYDRYKDISLEYFLNRYDIFPSSEELKQMATGRVQIAEADPYQPFIQNIDGGYFIPGSSLKGAIRNTVLWKVMSDPGKKQWLQDFVTDKLDRLKQGQLKNRNNRRTGKRDLLEKFSIQFTGPGRKTLMEQSFIIDKNTVQGEYSDRWRWTNEILRDVFRVIKVSDANFINIGIDKEVARAVCVSGNNTYQKEFDIHLQSVSPESSARFKITIDLNLAETFFGKGNLPFYLQSVENLLATVNEFFQKIWAEEKTFFTNKKSVSVNDYSKKQFKADTQDIEKFYSQLPTDYIFRTGWGGGLLSKTQFLNLEPEQRKGIRDLKMQRNEPAPKSRTLIVGGEKAITPLGWCQLKIVEDTDLPSLKIHTSVKKSDTSKKKTQDSEAKSDVLKKAYQKALQEPAEEAKSKYKKGEVIRNARITEAGEKYKIQIKGQKQPADLIGKPPMYARVMNVVVAKIENGIVTEVRKQ